MSLKLAKGTLQTDNVYLLATAAVGGKKEGEGPLKLYFDKIFDDEYLGTKTFETAETKLQSEAVGIALNKGGITAKDVDCVFAGDLLSQCIASSFCIRDLKIPFVGLYGACSTMVLSLATGAMMIDAAFASTTLSVTSSHFCASERQFRFPLEYGSQRPPTAQWTVTASGAALLTDKKTNIKINRFTIGKICDLGVTDANNMGAAMAPDDVKIRPYPRHEGMVFFYTQIYIKGGLSHYI